MKTLSKNDQLPCDAAISKGAFGVLICANAWFGPVTCIHPRPWTEADKRQALPQEALALPLAAQGHSGSAR